MPFIPLPGLHLQPAPSLPESRSGTGVGRSPVTRCLPNQFLHLPLSFLQSRGSCRHWVRGKCHRAVPAHGPHRHLDVPGCPNNHDLPAPCPLGGILLPHKDAQGRSPIAPRVSQCISKAGTIPAALNEFICVSLNYRCVSGGSAWSFPCSLQPSSATVLVQ